MASIRANSGETVEHPPTIMQYFDGIHAKLFNDPERRLLLAVLLDAVIEYQRQNGDDALEAEAWFHGLCVPPFRFSFVNVCAELGIDPDWLRKGIFKLNAISVERATAMKREVQTSRRQHHELSKRRVYRKRKKRRAQSKQSNRCAKAA